MLENYRWEVLVILQDRELVRRYAKKADATRYFYKAKRYYGLKPGFEEVVMYDLEECSTVRSFVKS